MDHNNFTNAPYFLNTLVDDVPKKVKDFLPEVGNELIQNNGTTPSVSEENKDLTYESSNQESKESLGEEETRRSRRAAAINQRLLMKKIASQEPNIEGIDGDESESVKSGTKKRRNKREYTQYPTSSCEDLDVFNNSVYASFIPNQQFFPFQWNNQMTNNHFFNQSQDWKLSQEGDHEQLLNQQLEELEGSQVYNFNERESANYILKKKKKILVNMDQLFASALQYIERYLIQKKEELINKGIEELRGMGAKNVQIDPTFLAQLGGNYDQFRDEVEVINKTISTLQAKLNELHTEMGKSIMNKINEPAPQVCCTLSPSNREKDKNALKYEEILEEMKDFQDLVSDEHREKRRIFKVLVTNTSKYVSKLELDVEKNKSERNKQVIQIHRNISNMIDLFWKKIEKFAWEHLKKDLNEELMKKKKQNLDKFIQDAIKLSINDQDRYILDKKIKSQTTIQTTNQQKTVQPNKPDKTDKSDDIVEDEYVMNKEDERMELDDLKLEDDMDSDKEENELNDLQKEAEMPIEELLKMYQRDDDQDDLVSDIETDYDEDESQSELDQQDSTQDQPKDDSQTLKQDFDGIKEDEPAKDELVNHDELVRKEYEEVEKVKESDDIVEDEYVMNKEDERMELDDLKLEDDMDSDKEENELNDLQKEAEMPIEELLKMYQRDDSESDKSPSVKRKKREKTLETETKGHISYKREECINGVKEEEKEVDIEIPFLIKGVLRPYQKEGLRWLVSLYERNINGILADEMGLGKTLQTISLLAYLACFKGNWGPHIIIVPTSILLNWVMEFNKFCPGFKLLAYYGTPAERAKKRAGWNKPYGFNVLISSYAIVVQDSYILKRKSWEYMILDEAQNIKNFNSKRWQTLLTFNTKYRLLLTGTPLQNSLQELWSLMHFILPNIFTSHSQFNFWFTDPLNQALDNMYSNNPLYKDTEFGKQREEMNRNNMELVEKLHVIFRPYLLRRLKKDVEKQMPSKYEHVLKCTLTKRQQVLYDEYISLYNLNSRKEGDREKLSYRSMLNILIQLRKICNHPDQLKSRDIQIPIEFNINTLQFPYMLNINKNSHKLVKCDNGMVKRRRGEMEEKLIVGKVKRRRFCEDDLVSNYIKQYLSRNSDNLKTGDRDGVEKIKIKTEETEFMREVSRKEMRDCKKTHSNSESLLSNREMSERLLNRDDNIFNLKLKNNLELNDIIESYLDLILNFLLISLKVVSKPVKLYFSGLTGINYNNQNEWHINDVRTRILDRDEREYYRKNRVTVEALKTRYNLLFPSKRSINDDCGKFKVLGPLLLRLKSEQHRCIIYTQFSKMLDILENWINFMGFTYIRLDGSTKIDMRQKIINRFNENTKIFLFISSTRTGGVGITLTGADTVIFYDTDWNPAIDRQAMDRCHRIGQTKDVNVYRLISEHTVEENIWRKQLQKRKLDDLIVDQGQFDVQHNNWFSNIDTLINIFQDKRDEEDNEDIYGKKILHESNVENPETKGVQNIKMLIEVEDVDDSMALKRLTKENENINQDFENDIINTIPSLVTYCIQFLLKYQTLSLSKQVENMKLKIQIEDYQHNQHEEEDEDDIYTDYTTSQEDITDEEAEYSD